MAEKDKPETQRARLSRLLHEVQPGYLLTFKNNSAYLRFRIDDEEGKPIGSYHFRRVVSASSFSGM